MATRKKRTFTKSDIGKVFRWKAQSNWSGTFWAGNEVVSLKNDALFLCHTGASVWGRGGRAYLYKPNRKNKWLLGDVQLFKFKNVYKGYWEELTPLEVLILFGNNLPRKYKRKQFAK